MRRVMVLVLMRRFMRRDLGMFVRGRPMTVPGMLVIGIRVSVQRGDVGGSAYEGEAGHDGDEALHKASVWNHGLRVKLASLCGSTPSPGMFERPARRLVCPISSRTSASPVHHRR
jgi:hypothetical protein